MNQSTPDNSTPPQDEDSLHDEAADPNHVKGQPEQFDLVHDGDEPDNPLSEDGSPTLKAHFTPEEVEELRAERDALHNKYLRALADYQNFARRSAQNVEAARDETRMQMAKALIPVMDHFDRALEVDIEKVTTEDLLRGVQIVHDELMRTLEQFGVQRLEAEVGGEFDPNRHEALMRQAVEGLPPDCIAQQLQVGYTLGDMTLRPAKVAVSE